ncbi:selenide, water dikinase SelD [Bacillaceae bacterium IKA-2]|nr:selenide, water dikinase SelD [Bacillaceae bacterium IKA-2]
MRSSDLTQVLRNIPISNDKNLIAGIGEDAVAYNFNGQTLLQTVDVITPVVDDPYQFGAIAAANSLSDIYAKGGTPLFALNIIGFPLTSLPLSYLEEIIRGGVDKVSEAGIAIVGGHTIDDVPKYGLSVTGYIPDGKTFISKEGAEPGDLVFLTKPIGTGVYITALDQNVATNKQINEVTNYMIKLNKNSAEAMCQCVIHACTDVTGYGLIGHSSDIAEKSQVTIELVVKDIPLLKDALSLLDRGLESEGINNNFQSFNSKVEHLRTLPKNQEMLFYDPQTSGGLIIVVAPDQAEKLQSEIKLRNETLIQIGTVKEQGNYPIQLR